MVREPVRALVERAVRQPTVTGDERFPVGKRIDDRFEEVGEIERPARYATFATENPPTPSPVVSPAFESLANV